MKTAAGSAITAAIALVASFVLAGLGVSWVFIPLYIWLGAAAVAIISMLSLFAVFGARTISYEMEHGRWWYIGRTSRARRNFLKERKPAIAPDTSDKRLLE